MDRRTIAAAAVAAAFAGAALAQPAAYPTRTVKIVAPVQPGGGVDLTARTVAEQLALMLGYVATHGTVPAVRKVPYDALKDFTPIAMVVGTPNVLVMGAVVPVTDMKGLVDDRGVASMAFQAMNKAHP